MKSLGKLLRKHIDDNGYTIYKAASAANINRTTLQKVLTDDRQASEELLRKLLPLLKLSPDEDAEIWKQFEILKTGESLYAQRQYIKDMIESAANLDLFLYSQPDPPVTDSGSPHDPVAQLAPAKASGAALAEASKTSSQARNEIEAGNLALPPLPIHGLYNVHRLLSSLLSEELAALTQLCPPKQILISAPGNLPILGQLFIHNLPHSHDLDKIVIKHITPLIKSPENTLSPLTNLDILTNIFPFAVSQAFHYEVYSFYRNELLADPFHYTFPFFIIFSRAVILISLDGNTALPLTEPATINHYRDLFHASLKKSQPLIINRSYQEKEEMGLPAQEEEPKYVIRYQPCLTPFLTEELLYKYVKTVLPQRSALIKTIFQSNGLHSGSNHQSCIFSKAGLAEFALMGTCPELPARYANQFDIPDRIKLLDALFQACKNDRAFLRLVNPVTLALPKHLSFVISRKTGIDFSCCDSKNVKTAHIRIAEPSILEAFADFYDYLCKSNLIYKKEDTLKEIEYVIAGLSEKPA